MKNINISTSEVKFTLDIYSKSVLTVIAVCLLLIVINLYFKPVDLQALAPVQDVNIKSINGQSIKDDLPIDIKSINGRNVWGDQLPMDLKSINGISIFGSEIPVRAR